MNTEVQEASQNQRWLRLAVQNAFPEQHTALYGVQLGHNLEEAWHQLTSVLKVSDDDLTSAVAEHYGLDLAELDSAKPFATRLVPEEMARKYHVLPMGEDGNSLVVAVSDPFNEEALEQLKAVSARHIITQLASPLAIDNFITANYSRALRKQTERLINLDQEEEQALSEEDQDSAAAQLGMQILRLGIDRGASDIHVQPFAGGGVIRCRIDGVLQRIATLPSTVFHALVRQVKALGGMDPSNDRKPQDGQLATTYQGREVEMRVSTLPCRGGERLVMRLHEQGEQVTLEALEFPPAELAAMLRIIQHTSGIFLVTGPTGSGKTTTLYALLDRLNQTGINIITIENPVEQEIVGISQVEVNPAAGLTFSSALRSILRQDPDVVLVGEIRDAETADIAVQAALTGHLVLSTLHTNDALTAIPRLLDLDVPAALVADSVIGVSAQRLLRKLCPACKRVPGETQDAASELFTEITGNPVGALATGCPECDYSGYKGRLPVAEIIEVGDPMREALVAEKTDLASLREATQGRGRSMSTVTADWIVSGVTSPDEASRVLGGRFWRELCIAHDHPVTTLPPLATDARTRAQHLPDILTVVTDAEQETLLRSALDSIGLLLSVANTIEEAIEKLRRESSIRMLLLDVDQPGIEARPLLRQLRASFTWAGLPFLLLLRENDEETGELLESYGVSDYLYKPFDATTLAQRVKAVLSR